MDIDEIRRLAAGFLRDSDYEARIARRLPPVHRNEAPEIVEDVRDWPTGDMVLQAQVEAFVDFLAERAAKAS